MTQVLVGKLEDPKFVQTSEGVKQLGKWDYRAMWAWLRFNYERKKIDAEIKEQISEKFPRRSQFPDRLAAMRDFFAEKVENPSSLNRQLQFITVDGRVKAVASLQHLLIPPEKVYKTAAKIIQLKKAENEVGMDGDIYFMKEVAGLNFGLQVFGGNILTRNAIKVAGFIRVELCTNPISWLGVAGFLGWVKTPSNFERVLRIEKTEQLKPRLSSAIMRAKDQFKEIEMDIDHSRKVPVIQADANRVLAAMSLSYGLGAKTIRQVFDQFKDEDQTQWGMSMATSYIAKHGDHKHPFTGAVSETTKQKLSTISGAILLVDDMEAAHKQSMDWLKSHIKEGSVKKVAELVKELGIK